MDKRTGYYSPEEVVRIKNSAYQKGVKDTWKSIENRCENIGDYVLLYNAVHGLPSFPNGFSVEIKSK